MVKINNIKIQGIGPINDLELNFEPHFNIICGQNGIGKTTILECISQSFSIINNLKKTSWKEHGNWEISTLIDNVPNNKRFDIKQFHPYENSSSGVGFYENANDVIFFKTHRNIPYKKLPSLSTDKLKTTNTFASKTVSGSLPDDIKNWFINRYLFSAQAGALDDSQLKNYTLAKECFQILNSDISFNKVIPNSFEILLNTPLGEIYFEYLSSGYKSCLAVLLGLIQEVELRYKNPNKYIREFEGIVIIDELDLHLHPEWQAKIYEALKMILPKAQIFTSTHSPHIIQIAKPNEIIALIFDDVKNIKLNPIKNEVYGFQGWTVEEILTDVMGMGETRTETYLTAINSFNVSIDKEDFDTAQKYFEIIDKMLHPENSLRKILKIQLIGADND